MSIRNRRTGLAAAAALLVAALVPGLVQQSAEAGPPTAKKPDRPTRVVQIVLDQLRPEFIDEFHMTNVKRLMRGGASYPERLPRPHGLGDRGLAQRDDQRHAAQAHGLVRRVVPRHRRAARRRRRPVRHRVHVGAAVRHPDQRRAAIPKLADYLHAKYPDKIVATIGEKNYAVHTMGGPGADMRITFGSRTADCDDVPNEPTDLTWRGPAGVGVPAYIAEPVCGRFYVDADQTSTTAPSPPRRPGCTRSRATATSPAPTPTTSVATSG